MGGRGGPRVRPNGVMHATCSITEQEPIYVACARKTGNTDQSHQIVTAQKEHPNLYRPPIAPVVHVPVHGRMSRWGEVPAILEPTR